jgi:hypothetical protein
MVIPAVMMAVAVVMRVIGALDIAAAREHENAPIGMHHLDIRAVEF